MTKLEPSARVRPGVFIETNEHYRLEGDDAAGQLMKVLEESWQAAQGYGRKVGEQLIDEFYKGRPA